MINTDTYKVVLEAELAKLSEEMATIGVHDAKDAENWIERTDDIDNVSADEIDVADKTEEWIERRGTISALETQYNNVARALEKIESGTYGVCEICAKDIEVERLDANPSARTCIEHRDDERALGVQ